MRCGSGVSVRVAAATHGRWRTRAAVAQAAREWSGAADGGAQAHDGVGVRGRSAGGVDGARWCEARSERRRREVGK